MIFGRRYPQLRDLVRGHGMADPQPMPRDEPDALPRLALTKLEAASALGVSVDFFEQHVMHELRIVRRGRRRLIPLTELQRWLDDSAYKTVD